ncbi:hypothetical protein ALQ76_05313 [Pseudomonas syringae pv. atrofaciens]|nr:hypothetical protein ALQ76_05313 [Pseudomonas syringae pv. atrofaciens]
MFVTVLQTQSLRFTAPSGLGVPASSRACPMLQVRFSSQNKSLQELARARQKCGTTGAVIAELKFVFWEKMFTKRFEGRIWAPYLYRFFPNLEKCFTVSAHRAKIAADLEQIRLLRNRIAHHEPIFSRNLRSDFAVIQRLTEARCAVSADWMNGQRQVISTVATKPF